MVPGGHFLGPLGPFKFGLALVYSPGSPRLGAKVLSALGRKSGPYLSGEYFVFPLGTTRGALNFPAGF